MTLTRRQTLAAALAAGLATSLAALPALAQSVDVAALNQPGPLEEKALGSPDAPVTIIEYASMTCPHCADFDKETFPELKKKYIDTGKVRFILREFPLDPLAAAAFMLARCAPDDRYFDMVDLFFQKQREWAYSNDPLSAMFALAKQAGFTKDSFEACLTNQKLLDGINAVKDRAADEFAVDSTPTFFINGERLRGAQGIQAFDEKIEPHLRG